MDRLDSLDADAKLARRNTIVRDGGRIIGEHRRRRDPGRH
jgi:hypothetical protein